MEIRIGADPELAVKQNGKYVSGYGLIVGDKANPHKVKNGAVQVDGMALEFNIDPASSPEEFITNIDSVMAQLRSMVPDYELAADPVAKFGKEYMATQPEEALELGCDPDYNAYEEGAPNPRPDGDVDFRTMGGHVHIGWTEGMDIADPGHVEACMMLARELDYYLGIPSLFWDSNDERRAMYGKPGAYRVKPYGVEYRSLSNAWIKDAKLMRFVFQQTKKAVENLLAGKSIYEEYGNVAALCINNSDRLLANKVADVTRKWTEVTEADYAL